MNKKTLRIAGWALGLSMAVAGMGAAIFNSNLVETLADTDSAGVYTVDLTGKGYGNGNAVTSVSLTNAKFSMTFAQGSNETNAPKYYSSGTSVRTYSGNTLTLTPKSGYQITAVAFTYDSTNYSETANIGTLSADKSSWSGTATNAAPLVLTTSSSQTRYQTVAVTYSAESSDPVLSIDNYDGTWAENYIVPGESGTFAFSWDVATPNIDEGVILWTTTGTNASKLTIDGETGAFTADPDITVKTEVTVSLEILDNKANEYSDTLVVYICPHALDSEATLSRTSLKDTFTIDDTISIVQSGSKLKATFMDVGEKDVLNLPEYYGGTISYSIGGTPVPSDYKMLKSDNGKSLVVSYTFAGKTVSASGYVITVKDKDVDNPSIVGGWNLVTNASTLAAGDVVIIAAAGSEVAMSTTQNSNNRGQTAIDKSNDRNSLDEAPSADVQRFTLVIGKESGSFGFYTGEGYIYAASSSKNYLKTEDTLSNDSSFTISISNGNATVTAQGSNTHNLVKYNSSSKIFSCYESGQSAVAIYKLSEPTNNDYLQNWVFNYMHFQTIAEADGSAGTACKGDAGYYLTAKAALNALEAEHSGCMSLLQTGPSFVSAKERYEAWAVANGDGAPYDKKDTIVTPLNAALSNSMGIERAMDNNLPVIITIASTSFVAMGGAFLFVRKRRNED